MMKYFKYSFFVTILGIIAGYLWGEHLLPGNGFKALLIVLFLAILEITLSFDNAIVNAMRLEKMSKFWEKIFLTWGILIAVFGMRLLFPILIVSIFSSQSMINVFKMALNDITQYTHYLHVAHVPLVTFGGVFLFMIFLTYFLNCDKETCWLPYIEKKLVDCGHIKSMEVILALLAICGVQYFAAPEMKVSVILSGIGAIITFLVINDLSELLEKYANAQSTRNIVANAGLINFLYLELIDASFSLDGLLGAFAISKDIIIITIGLAVGAMFVRSLTIFFVEEKTLTNFKFLEHGAHWAIGFLALIMLVSTKIEIPEAVTGLVSLGIILAAFVSSIITKQKENYI